jgi:hypothetical protein
MRNVVKLAYVKFTLPSSPMVATIEAPAARYERLLAMLGRPGRVDPALARRLDKQPAALAQERESR